jgi:hypothetical protein
MASTKTGSSFWYVFFDCHVWITETNQLNLIALASKNRELLIAARSPFRFIKAGKRLAAI